MPSPFPGMNPFLEQDDTWDDFHHEFLTRARALLAAQVGPDHFVKVAVRSFLHELSAEERSYSGRLTPPAVEIARHSWLEVRDRRDQHVITVIEMLVPEYKERRKHREAYLAKRNEILAGQTHLVEIDLLRGGERPPMPQLPMCDYYALLSRCEDRPKLDFWPIALRERLPTIPVPLAGTDPNAQLDLQRALDQAYDAANYGKYVYSENPQPPLSAADAEWARQFIP